MPPALRALFVGAEERLHSHEGWDLGALRLAKRLGRALDVPVVASQTSRLVVDLNRSLSHPRLFSSITKGLRPEERRELLDAHYRPLREGFAAEVERRVAMGEAVLHLSVHSFTPVLAGRTREVDLGLLYDPGRRPEAELARCWVEGLRGGLAGLRVRRNAPYRGRGDGHTSALRRRFDERDYMGFEIELNQQLAAQASGRAQAAHALAVTLRQCLAGGARAPNKAS